MHGRIVQFACDFTAEDPASYFHDLLQGQSLEGLVINQQFSPVVALLRDGKYTMLRRDAQAGRRAVYDLLLAQLAAGAGK